MNLFDINNTIITILQYPLSYVEFIGTISGLLSVWLATKQNIFTWTIGLINVICFFSIFYQVQLYSDMFLQVFFFIASVYGWLAWRDQQQAVQPISLLSNGQRIFWFILIVSLTITLGILVKNIHLMLPNIFPKPASFPFVDTFIAVSSILATILLAKRILENWILWVIVDICCLIVYAKKDIIFISIEYGIFLIIASYGLFLWTKSYRHEKRISFR